MQNLPAGPACFWLHPARRPAVERLTGALATLECRTASLRIRRCRKPSAAALGRHAGHERALTLGEAGLVSALVLFLLVVLLLGRAAAGFGATPGTRTLI